MNNKRYPTRMHEVLGVEPEERFSVYCGGLEHKNFYVNKNGDVLQDGMRMPDDRLAVFLVNHPGRIVRKPRLSEEQVAQLRACIEWFDSKWLAKQRGGTVMAFKEKPHKKAIWFSGTGDYMEDYGWCVKKNSPICSLVSWSDSEPLDIVATLKANGVEVEG